MKLLKNLISIFAVLAIGLANITLVFSSELADPNDHFSIQSPTPNQSVKGTINVVFSITDNNQSQVQYTAHIYDASCSNTNYGRINSDNTTSGQTTIPWLTSRTLQTTNLNDGTYCLKICAYFLNSASPYSACKARHVKILNNNSLPVINSFPSKLSFFEGETFSYQIIANDPDGDTLQYRLVTTAPFLSINPNTGVVSSSPLSTLGNQAIAYPITVGVTDNQSGEVYQSFTIEVRKAPTTPSQPGQPEAPTPGQPPTQPEQPGTEEPQPENPEQPGAFELEFLTPVEGFDYTQRNILVSWSMSTIQGLASYTLEYAQAESEEWTEIAQIDKDRTYFLWNIEDLPSQSYKVRLKLNFANGQEVIHNSKIFNVIKEGSEDPGELPVDSVPLIINNIPRNNAEITDQENFVISADMVASKDAEIVEDSLEIKLDGRIITESCTVENDSFKCEPEVNLSEGRHIISASVEDTNEKKATFEWVFSMIVSETPGGTDSEFEEVQTIEIFGRRIVPGTLILLLILCCVVSTLLFVPWILYSVWGRSRDEDKEYDLNEANYTLPPVEDLPTLQAYSTQETVQEPIQVQTQSYIEPYPTQNEFVEQAPAVDGSMYNQDNIEIVTPTAQPAQTAYVEPAQQPNLDQEYKSAVDTGPVDLYTQPNVTQPQQDTGTTPPPVPPQNYVDPPTQNQT